VALLAATYLAYTVFDDWYIRFRRPRFPVIALSVRVLRSLTQWLGLKIDTAATTMALGAVHPHGRRSLVTDLQN
jgi:hypothetical protein